MQCSCVSLATDTWPSNFLKPTKLLSNVSLRDALRFFSAPSIFHYLPFPSWLGALPVLPTGYNSSVRSSLGMRGQGWPGSLEIEAQKQASKLSLGWIFWTPRSRKELWGVGVEILWKESCVIHVELPCFWPLKIKYVLEFIRVFLTQKLKTIDDFNWILVL